MPADESSSSVWSRDQDKRFEKAIASYPEDSSDRWERIAADVPGKSVEEILYHYKLLVDDVNRIELGFVEVPCYISSSDGLASHFNDDGAGKKSGSSGLLNGDSNHGGKALKSDQERRKGVAWTEDEHRLFLLGLENYGKGDWRSISRNFVITRTPTQVASHAQKYFIRLNSMNKDRRRTSIHDITSVNSGEVSVPQAPISSGQTNGSAVSAVYGAAPPIGQPMGGPAVGTPVSIVPYSAVSMGDPGPPLGIYPFRHP